MSARRPVRRVAAGIVAAVLACGLLAGCSSSGGSSGSGGEQGFVAGDGSIVVVPPEQRVAAPDLVGTTLDGDTFRLSDHRGQVVVLNVWASWCAPCRAEADDLKAVSEQFADSGVQFVGLNTKDSDAAANAFVERFGMTYPNVVDADGTKQLLFGENLPPAAIPSTLVIDREGRVAARAIGEVDRSRLLGLIEPILAEGAESGGEGAASGAASASPPAES